MNTVIVDDKGELVAYVSDKHPCIIRSGYQLVNYGNAEPVFTDVNGRIFLNNRKFIIDLKGDQE